MAMSAIPGFGIELYQRLLDVLPDERTLFEMSEKELRSITQSRSRVWADDFRRNCLENAKREAEFVERSGIRLICVGDSDYPIRFDTATDAPVLLYALGDCDLNSKHVVSIVGTRKSTEYGAHFCASFVGELGELLGNDVIIVSGLAYGTDINAHRAAMHHNIPTVAVLAGGLNKIYPSLHRNDAAKMARGAGMVLTEYTSQEQMHKANFLARNRIVAALSDCTVVVESAIKGGALVTASIAQSYGRDVFALPGRVTDTYSAGCNKLILSNRAGVVTCAEDLVRQMRWLDVIKSKTTYQPSLFPEITDEEQLVVNLLTSNGDMHVNNIAEKLSMPVYRIMAILMELDCKNVVMTLPGSRFSMAKAII